MAYKVADKEFETLAEAVKYSNEIDYKHNRQYMFEPAKRIDTTIIQVENK